MRKRRLIWTPDELLAEAQQVVEAVSASFEKPVAPAQEQPIPALLPKPDRVQTQPVKAVSVAELRKAQKRERARRKFNRKVKKAVRRQSNELIKALKTQSKAALKAVKSANVAHKIQREAQSAEQVRRAKAALAQAKAALKAAEAARKQAEKLRKQLEAAIAWLKAERKRQSWLNAESRERIARAKASATDPEDED